MKTSSYVWAQTVGRVPGLGRWLERLQRLRVRAAQLAARPVVAELKDLKNMTVRALRELARSVVGPGHSSLKTRSELMDAIVFAMSRRRGEKAGGTGDERAWERGRGSPGQAREPRPEGHLVSRIRGEAEAHEAPHVLTEDRLAGPSVVEQVREAEAQKAQAWDEGLGDLPWAYEDDALVALARDPHTLWVYWDHAHHTVREAMRGLQNPHAKMRIYEQGRLLRELDFSLESRSFYISDLAPGGYYRVELFFYGTEGGQHRIGRPSNTIGLPPRGPSPIIDDRFVTLPWGMPLARRHDLFERALAENGFSGEERDALFAASTGRPLGASENVPPGAPGGVAGGGNQSGRPWSGSRYEGA